MGGYTLQQLRGYSFDEIKTLFETTMRKVNTFVPIEGEVDRADSKLAARSSKRDAEEELDQESSKRQKTGTRKYWKIIRVGNHTKVHQFFDDMLKALDRDDLVMLLSLVKDNFKSTKPTDDKEREIWVELKRLFEPDTDDELWKLQKHIHDLTWRLYDLCGVHHMLVAKLLVDQDNEMSKELLRKIFMQAEIPKR
ncbi:hypothetical protein Tco_0050640 [Tanacetum coccineum]